MKTASLSRHNISIRWQHFWYVAASLARRSICGTSQHLHGTSQHLCRVAASLARRSISISPSILCTQQNLCLKMTKIQIKFDMWESIYQLSTNSNNWIIILKQILAFECSPVRARSCMCTFWISAYVFLCLNAWKRRWLRLSDVLLNLSVSPRP